LKGGYWNYDECKFLGKSPVQVNGVAMENNTECKTQIMDYLKNAPDLQVYYYRAWSDDQRNKLHTILQDISGNPGEAYRKLTPSEKGETKTETPKTPNKKAEKASTTTDSDQEDMEEWLNGVG
jgi:hypothetical protein